LVQDSGITRQCPVMVGRLGYGEVLQFFNYQI